MSMKHYFQGNLSLARLLAATTLLFSSFSLAVPIVGVNDPVNNTANFTWSGSSIFIENTSNFDARITAFGFDTSSTLLGLDSVTGTEDNSAWALLLNQTVGGAGGGTFEFGVSTGANLTGGFPNAGIAVGNTGTFDFNLDGGTFADMSNFYVRFQRTANGSDRGVECVRACTPVQVTEPGTLGLIALGVMGVFAGRMKVA